MTQSVLTQERVRELLHFDAKRGALVWKIAQSNRIKVGQDAGVVAANGRRYVNIDGEKHLAHRLIWFYVNGVWPTGNVAPANGDYLDTRIENLVEESFSETARKGRRRISNKSGVPGVSWDNTRQRWIAKITRDYRPVTLGRFSTKEEAAAAVASAGGMTVDVPAEERRERAAVASVRARQRALWDRTLRDAGGVTGWANIQEFISDVGSAPKANHDLIAIDPHRPIGPGNFSWSAPAKKFDYKTREGRIAANKAHRAENPLLYRNKELNKKFGIDLSRYMEMHERQSGLCAICNRPQSSVRNTRKQWLAVDHDHATGAIRDLLCTNCNVAIGMLCDDVSILRKAIAYLVKHGAQGAAEMPQRTIADIAYMPRSQKLLLMEAAGHG